MISISLPNSVLRDAESRRTSRAFLPARRSAGSSLFTAGRFWSASRTIRSANPAIEQLESALTNFTGTLLLVSHDRKLLDAVAITRTIEMDSDSAYDKGLSEGKH